MKARMKDTLLLVGDAASDRVLLREIFAESYHLLEAENPEQAEVLIQQNYHCVAAVLADVPLEEENRVRCLSSACSHGTENEIPLLLLIAPDTLGNAEEKALSLGAVDVINKPYTHAAVQRRVQIIVDFFLHKWHLEKLVSEQSETIRNTNQVMVDALSTIIEHRSTESGNHILRIRRFTKILLYDVARSCPEYNLTNDVIDIIANAAALHDIGKISIPDAILNKPGRLTPEEYEVIKTHTTVGSQLVEQLGGIGDTEYLRYAYNIALYHHERWDGNGYPMGLVGDETPICAQVVGLADAFDALTTPRVYKPALPSEQAINMILNGECGAFSPKLLECFKHARAQMVALAERYGDGYSPKLDHINVPLPGPVWKSDALDTLQLSQLKYQTLLHYIDGTVLELEPKNDLCHLIYNPDPDLESLFPVTSFRGLLLRLRGSKIHPEDRGVAEEISHFVREEIYQSTLRRRSFHFRFFCPSKDEFRPYELVFLQVHTGVQDQHIVLVVFRKTKLTTPDRQIPVRSTLHSAPALYGLVSSAIRCCSDENYTIDAGMRDLFLLTGYGEEDLRRLFAGQFLKLVAVEDREVFRSTMGRLVDSGGIGECEFRLLRKDDTPLWVLAKSRIYVEADGREYYYFAIRDNSRSRATQQALRSGIERNRTIIEEAGGITFDWDLETDVMRCSSKWEEHFGYPPVSRNYSAQMGIATHFHPDDLPTMREYIARLRGGLSHAAVDVRIANGEGHYLWYKITATPQTDERGKIVRLIGMLQNVDELKRAAIVLKEQAERDALTKLFNKASTQRLASEYLRQREPNAIAALLVLDLDNFKGVNDTYGHLYGDAVLSQIGGALRRMFRANDVIGRVGGDEFVILLKDIPNEQVLHSRCELILATFRDLFVRVAPTLDISFSVGAALVPAHGNSYGDLFRHADEALYRAKSGGKNAYRVYNPQEKFDSLREKAVHINTRIDSDEQPGMANDSFSRFVFHRLYESTQFEQTVDEILAYIGQQFNVSRVYIFENDPTNTTCSNTFEWCNEGIVPQIKELQNIHYERDIAGWRESFDERGVIYCQDISTLAPHIRSILEAQGIKSMLQCAIRDGGEFRGYVGFDECTTTRMWTRDQIALLEYLAKVLAVFLTKKRAQDNVRAQTENLRGMLDSQDSCIYVIDPDTCVLHFCNEKVRSIAPECREGQLCYQAIMGRRQRCENCPAFKQEDGIMRGKAVVENVKQGEYMALKAKPTRWNGQEACLLVSCRETKQGE